MALGIDLSFETEVLRSLEPKRIQRAIVRALKKGGSTALRDMRSELIKQVRARKKMKKRTIGKALRTRRQTRGNRIPALMWALDVSDQPARVADYPHKEKPWGVAATINVGSTSLLRGAFVATMKSGHKGVFKRRGKGRLPIDEQLASRVIDAVSMPGVVEAILERGRRSLDKTVDRVFPAELDKLL